MGGADREPLRLAILGALAEAETPLGAQRLADQLAAMGFQVPPRTTRYHLQRLDREGLTRVLSRRRGREITPAGRDALAGARVVEKMGFVAARVDDLGYRMTYDPLSGEGRIVANISEIAGRDLSRAIQTMRPVIRARLGMGERLAVGREGDTLVGRRTPSGRAALATICSVVVNGLLLHRGIPVASRFGGLLELRRWRPARFTALMDYRGTTVDPLELFIAARMTRVLDAARTGDGIVGASFREIPAAALPALMAARAEWERAGLGAILAVGRPNQPVLEIPVAEGRAGLIVAGGLNPIAALVESGIETEVTSLAGLEDYGVFKSYDEILAGARDRGYLID